MARRPVCFAIDELNLVEDLLVTNGQKVVTNVLKAYQVPLAKNALTAVTKLVTLVALGTEGKTTNFHFFFKFSNYFQINFLNK